MRISLVYVAKILMNTGPTVDSSEAEAASQCEREKISFGFKVGDEEQQAEQSCVRQRYTIALIQAY